MLWKKSRLTIALNTDSSLTKGFSNFLYGPFWVLYYACANLSPFFQLYPEKFNPYPSHHIIGGYIFYFSVFLFSFFGAYLSSWFLEIEILALQRHMWCSPVIKLMNFVSACLGLCLLPGPFSIIGLTWHFLWLKHWLTMSLWTL